MKVKWSELRKSPRFWIILAAILLAVTGVSVSLSDGKLSLSAEVDLNRAIDMVGLDDDDPCPHDHESGHDSDDDDSGGPG